MCELVARSTPKIGRAKARLRKAYVAASPMVCPTLCQGAPKRSDGDLIPSQPDRPEPLPIALKCFYILLVTVTQTRVKGSSTMAQTRRNEPYWRLNVLVRRGRLRRLRRALVGKACLPKDPAAT
jgi:hypothetical protein